MPAAPVSEAPAGRPGAALLSRFAAVGLLSTAVYAVLALLLSGPWIAFPQVAASAAAYATATVFSYLAQKFVTFRSPGAHRQQAPRFAAAAVLGFAVATIIPAVTAALGAPVLVPVALTCVLVPVLSFLLLSRWVFAEPRR